MRCLDWSESELASPMYSARIHWDKRVPALELQILHPSFSLHVEPYCSAYSRDCQLRRVGTIVFLPSSPPFCWRLLLFLLYMLCLINFAIRRRRVGE